VINHAVVYSIGLKYNFWVVESNCLLGCDDFYDGRTSTFWTNLLPLFVLGMRAMEIVVLHCFGISLFHNIPFRI
jgi:hypothetical protein